MLTAEPEREDQSTNFVSTEPRRLWRGAGAALAITLIGLLIIGWAMIRSELLSAPVAMAATFAPLWLGGLIGWGMAAFSVSRHDDRPALRGAVAALIALPVSLVDPWAVVALGMGPNVSWLIKGLFFVAPLAVAWLFAYVGTKPDSWAPRRLPQSLFVLLTVNALAFALIYRWILPSGNPIASP